MALLDNLFKSRQQKNYDIRKTAVDARKNRGNDYSQNVLKKSISAYIFRNNTMNDFIILIQKVISDLIDSVTYMRSYKSYTTKKDDKRFR